MNGNHLADALSPYLLQHADNPVHWLEWNHEALNLARRLDRPILLSIGYSACHWCHVMAHESFEDEQTASLMNDAFVNIKVDREERPDLDRIYQLAHQLLSGRSGGWPLTVFLDPVSLAPFFTGTYFPPEPRHGLIAFPDLLRRIDQVWSTRREELREQNLQVQQALKAISQPQPAEERVSIEELGETLLSQLVARFDSSHGGFSQSPKFPQAPLLTFLEVTANDDQADQMLHDTLDAMARFGLRDHLGGGFFRYCVDQAWEIPHFEKMLSDNALLLGSYARAAHRWNNCEFKQVCRDIVTWLKEDMSLDGGGFAASLDADSPGGEGAFYLWKPQQVEAVLPPGHTELIKARFGLDGPANFEGKAWHLVTARGIDELTGPENDRDTIGRQIEIARTALLEARRKRTPPGRDDKLLASWNGLTIENLALAGRLLDQPDWIELAATSLDSTAVRLFGQEPPRAVWRDGRSAQTASLDDHACVLLACLELLQWRFESRWFNLARRLARRIDRQFVDAESGATYFTPVEHEPLLTRPLAVSDDATPAGAALAIRGLQRLGHLCADADMLRTARFMARAAMGDMQRSPLGHAGMVVAAAGLEQPEVQVLIGGPADEPTSWHDAVFHHTECAVFRVRTEIELETPPELIGRIQSFDRPTALVCSGLQCLEPAHSFDQLAERLHSVGLTFHVES
jgi:uncharacterized protein